MNEIKDHMLEEKKFQISCKLCEYLAQSIIDFNLDTEVKSNLLKSLIEKVMIINPYRNLFFFSGKFQQIEGQIVPELILQIEKFEGEPEDFKSYCLSQLNEYFCSITNDPLLFKRSQPWLATHSEFVYNPYHMFFYDFRSIQGIFGYNEETLIFQGIDVKLIPVEFNETMIVPKEFYFLHEFSHQFIANCLGLCKNIDKVYLVMVKYADTLEKFILNEIVSEETRILIVNQLIFLIMYLHAKNVLVSGIFPDKIWISKENGFQIKFFGFSKAEIIETHQQDCKGHWFTLANDIFSLGHTIFFIVTGKYFEKSNPTEHPSNFFRFFSSMISESISDRPTITQVHDFFASFK